VEGGFFNKTRFQRLVYKNSTNFRDAHTCCALATFSAGLRPGSSGRLLSDSDRPEVHEERGAMDAIILLLILPGVLSLVGVAAIRVALNQARILLRQASLFIGITLIHAAASLPLVLVCYACAMSSGGGWLGEIIIWTVYFPLLLLRLLGFGDSRGIFENLELLSINSPIWTLVFLSLVYSVRQLMTLFKS